MTTYLADSNGSTAAGKTARPKRVLRRTLASTLMVAALFGGGGSVAVSAITAPVASAATIDSLTAGGTMYAGDVLRSPNGQTYVTMQSDGNLVVYRQTGPSTREVVWHTNTPNQPGAYLVNQSDGNLVIYKPLADNQRIAIWQSGTGGRGAARLLMQDDQNLVLYSNTSGQATWSWKTGVINAAPTSSLTDRQLAQKIINSGRVTGDARYMNQIKAYAAGNYSCHINSTILWLINLTVSPASEGGLGHTVEISSLNRYCTGVLTNSGTTSYHYKSAGGHAVDFSRVDGVTATGASPADLRLFRELVRALPSGSGIGQSNCRSGGSALAIPAGVSQFADACNHDHIQVPVK